MYEDLPEQLKRKVRDYLLADDFKSAKQVHDAWMNNKQSIDCVDWHYTESV